MSELFSSPPRLFADRGCPYGQRVLALFAHLGAEHELVECAVGDKPEGLDRHSKHRRLPLLVHGELVLSESRVMLEHLAEHLRFEGALPGGQLERTRHRRAMALVDAHLAPLLVRRLEQGAGAGLDDALDALEDATRGTGPRPELVTLHVAPIWSRFRWWHPTGQVTRLVEARPELCRWLDRAVELDCVTQSAPDKAAHLADFDRAKARGLLPADFEAPAPPKNT